MKLNESDEFCLQREILEETGIDLEIKDIKPYLVVEYLCKDYPNAGDNTNYIANYYVVSCDEKPNLDNVELTEGEKEETKDYKFFLGYEKFLEDNDNG